MPSGLVETVAFGKLPYEAIPDGAGEARGENATEGWIHGLEIARLFGPELPDNMMEVCPDIALVVMQHAMSQERELHQVMVNKLAGGAKLEKHRDGPPAHQRWHFPIITNPGVTWWDELDGPIHMHAGEWWGPVNYCGILHSMTNASPWPRVHLIVDLL